MDIRILYDSPRIPKTGFRIGVDPGLKGGLAVISTDYPLKVYLVVVWAPPPGKTSPRTITPKILGVLENYVRVFMPCPVLIEDAYGWSRQGASSSHKLALSRATLQTFFQLAGCPLSFVVPRVWKRKFGLPGENKKPSLRLANVILPRRWLVKDDDGAESILIAWSADWPKTRPSILA